MPDMKNNDKNKEKITHKHVVNEIWVSLTIYIYFLTAQQIWNIIPGQFQASLQRNFGEILAMEIQNNSDNKLNNLEVTYKYVMQLREAVKNYLADFFR